jgi:hypothetical protein
MDKLKGNSMELSQRAKLSLYGKSLESGVAIDTLEEIYRRGYESYHQNSDRTAEQLGFERVNSFIEGGFAAVLDEDLLESIHGRVRKTIKGVGAAAAIAASSPIAKQAGSVAYDAASMAAAGNIADPVAVASVASQYVRSIGAKPIAAGIANAMIPKRAGDGTVKPGSAADHHRRERIMKRIIDESDKSSEDSVRKSHRDIKLSDKNPQVNLKPKIKLDVTESGEINMEKDGLRESLNRLMDSTNENKFDAAKRIDEISVRKLDAYIKGADDEANKLEKEYNARSFPDAIDGRGSTSPTKKKINQRVKGANLANNKRNGEGFTLRVPATGLKIESTEISVDSIKQRLIEKLTKKEWEDSDADEIVDKETGYSEKSKKGDDVDDRMVKSINKLKKDVNDDDDDDNVKKSKSHKKRDDDDDDDKKKSKSRDDDDDDKCDKGKCVGEEVDNIDEISRETLSSYRDKNSKRMDFHRVAAQKAFVKAADAHASGNSDRHREFDANGMAHVDKYQRSARGDEMARSKLDGKSKVCVGEETIGSVLSDDEIVRLLAIESEIGESSLYTTVKGMDPEDRKIIDDHVREKGVKKLPFLGKRKPFMGFSNSSMRGRDNYRGHSRTGR